MRGARKGEVKVRARTPVVWISVLVDGVRDGGGGVWTYSGCGNPTLDFINEAGFFS